MSIDYGRWVTSQSRSARVMMAIATPVLLGVYGLGVETLQATIGDIPTMILSWVVLLLAVYTLVMLAYTAVSGGESQ